MTNCQAVVWMVVFWLVISEVVAFGTFSVMPKNRIASNSDKPDGVWVPHARHHGKPDPCGMQHDTTELHLVTNVEPSDEEGMACVDRYGLQRRYDAGAILFGCVSLLLFGTPDRTNAVKLATKVGGAAGYSLAAIVSYILSAAARDNRLESDTFKRLNIGLLLFSGIGFLALPGEAAFHPKFSGCLAVMVATTTAKWFGFRVAYSGWRYGVKESSSSIRCVSLWNEIVDGTKTTLSGLFETTKKARAYRNYVLLVGSGIISALLQGQFNMKYKAPIFEITLQWSAVSRLCLLSTMIYSLKDAAERDRLIGTTFVKINLSIGLWALVVGIGQGTSATGFSISRTPMLLFAVPFLMETGKYQRQRLLRAKSGNGG